jgi:7-carboxy-7-deazaguanine synthase
MKHEISEIFLSLEGEGPFTAHPTAYIRFGRCNLKCPHFNNHSKEVTDKGYAPISFNPADYQSIHDIPLIKMGCDSQYAVNPAFAHMWEKMTTDELVDRLVDMLPGKSWVHPVTGLPVILSLTGGEPTLKWKFIPDILNHPKMQDCKHVLVETNCTVPFKRQFTMDISEWMSKDPERTWTWSNSPKLSASGEKWEDAIIPSIANLQREIIGDYTCDRVNQYFKFVVGPREEDFEEVARAMEEYYAAGIPRTPNVWIMPEACTQEQQQSIDQQVAKMCMEKGYMFCYRFQNALWGNGVGT